MRSTITIEKIVLDELVRETGLKSKSSATKAVITEYLRQKKIEKIMSLQGKLKFDKTAEEIRHYER
ncbi:MAG: hypothetical protein HY097_08105 [Nitrospinae bacterium]|nr:hypothetical protein [Nitrospinota bacterium]